MDRLEERERERDSHTISYYSLLLTVGVEAAAVCNEIDKWRRIMAYILLFPDIYFQIKNLSNSKLVYSSTIGCRV